MFKDLSKKQTRLLFSYFLYALASPMVVVYANTFLWRQDRDPVTLAIFNIGMYAGLSLGFLLNAYALRWWESGKLYALGCLLQGVVPMLLVSLGASATDYTFALGLAMGVAQGFFWANRNGLTSHITQGEHRYRFISLETTLGITAGILSPLAIGWFIALGATLPTYSVAQAYQWSAAVGLAIMCAAGALAWRFTVEPLRVGVPFVQRASVRWTQQRIVELLNGIASGIEVVVPLLLVLLLIGNEEAVGSIKALTGILSAAMIFTMSKRVKHKHHVGLVGVWLAASLLGAVAFAAFVSIPTAMAYFILAGLVGSLRWSSFVTVMYEVVDRETARDGEHRFLYLLDRESFLNLGRIIGLALLILAYRAAPQETIRYGLLAMYAIELPVLWILGGMTRSLEHQAITPPPA